MCASVGTPLASTASPSFVQRSSRESSASSLTWSRKTEVWLDQPQGRGHSLALKAINDALETRLGHIVTTNRPCDSRDSISPSFDTYTNVLNDLTAIFRPIAVFMRSTLRLGRRALHSVELSRTRVAKAIRFSEVQETMFPRREIEARVIADTSLRCSIGHIPCKGPGRRLLRRWTDTNVIFPCLH